MKKNLFAAFIAAALAATMLCGCSATSSSSSTTTETTTTTNSDGTQTTTTTTTTNDNGNVSTTTTTSTTDASSSETSEAAEDAGTLHENVPFDVVNDTDFDFYGFYLSSTTNDSWGENLLSYLDGGVLYQGYTANGLNLSYYEENPYLDFAIVDSDGVYVEFDEVDMTGMDSNFVITFYVADDGNYKINVSLAE